MENDATFWGQVVIAVVTVAGFIFQAWREGRNNRWAREREERLATKVEVQKAELARKIEENTALTATGVAASKEAIRVGNNFNEKLLAITGRFDEIGVREKARQTERIERIDHTTQETHDIARETNERVHDIAGDERLSGRR